MKRRPKQQLSTEDGSAAAGAAAILQVKVWLIGISPMVWRRVLVPAAFTLRELHGVIQVAMGWDGIHLYQFCLRAVRYGSWEVSASSPEVTLAGLRLCKGARFIYEYDLNIPWRHEIRIEDRLPPEGQGRPISSAPRAVARVPAGGVRRSGARSWLIATTSFRWIAARTLRPRSRIIGEFARSVGGRSSSTKRRGWQLEKAVERAKAREEAQGRPFSRRK